jgi:membrane associated rhomboid family serine protease/cytochrome c-type biogenesis protein CcmH/NrfG
MVFAKISPFHPSIEELLRWGADFGPLTLAGQWWRLLSSVFLHIGIAHLAVNMWCLWNLGELAERVYGRTAFLAFYVGSGIIGTIVSLAWHPFAVSAGASGAVFGLAGALIVTFWFGQVPFPRRHIQITLGSLLAFAGYNLVFGFITPGIGNAAHVGGLLAGLVLGFLLPRIGWRPMVAMTLIGIVAGCTLVARSSGYVVHEERGRVALASGKTDIAIEELSKATTQKPTAGEAYVLLGRAYMKDTQFIQAEAAYRRALALRPVANDVRYELGLVLAKQGRSPEAMEMFQEMQKTDPKNPIAPLGLGMAAMMDQNYGMALVAFRRVVELDPFNAQALYNMGMAAIQLQRHEEAIDAFSKVLLLQPRNYDAQLKLADAYRDMGMPTQAQAAYERARQLSRSKEK